MTMRQIDTRIWKDSWIRKLNSLDRYTFIYLLTNDNCAWCGIYELPLSVMAFETGIDERDLENSILPRLSDKVDYIDGWVCIRNFVKYHDTGSPNSQKGIENSLKLVPDEIMAKIKEKTNRWQPLATVGNCRHSSSSSSSSSSSLKEGSQSSPLSYQKVKETYKTKKQIADQKGIKLKTPHRSDKQKETTVALQYVGYYRDRASELHGFQFFKVQDEARNKKIRKLIIRADKETDVKALIDWWLNKGGEWADYEPENCFTAKTIEKFNNTKIRKKHGFKKHW